MNTCSICARPRLALGYCSTHYARLKRTGSARPEEPIGGSDARTRFNALVDRSAGGDGCWPWVGARLEAGYGRFTVDGREYKAHRYAVLGTESDPRVVMHTCDNPPCCNPAHLRLGTYLDNNRDRDAKGRGPTWRDMAHARLTPETANAIRNRYAAGGESQQKIADELGISQTLVSLVVRGRAWAPVQTGEQ